jgi:hypothetical protein
MWGDWSDAYASKRYWLLWCAMVGRCYFLVSRGREIGFARRGGGG